MKILALLSLFLLVSCSPKFHFRDKVHVKSGFYTGEICEVEDTLRYILQERVYFLTCPITLNGIVLDSYTIRVDESDLELIK